LHAVATTLTPFLSSAHLIINTLSFSSSSHQLHLTFIHFHLSLLHCVATSELRSVC